MPVFSILTLVTASSLSFPSATAKPRFLALVAESSAGLEQNPVSKVCDMLEGLSTEIETDKKMEQDLFDTYECWYKAVISAKKASNSEALEHIGALNSYIDDIESGRIEFSTEGADATKDVAELSDEIEKAAALRKKEKEDFEAAQEELTKSIDALKKAEKEMKEGAPVELLSSSNVLKMGQAVLSESDAKLLEQALHADPKSPDYKKMNKEKKFNKKFKVRSGKIQELISDMRVAFQDNLEQAELKEEEEQASFDKLKAAKESQLEAAKDALAALGGETASREEAVAEAKEEITAVEEQIEKDKGFMKDTEDAYKEKLGEWKERKKLMTLEIMSVSKALSILRSDEARDAMSTSFDKDKVYSFIQVSDKSSSSEQNIKKMANAVTALRVAAKKVHKGRELWALARKVELLKEDGRFDKVIEILEGVKKDLMKESKEDKKKKEECDKTLTEKTEEAQTSANIIDEKTRVINRTKGEVAELYLEVNKTIDEVAELEWELNDATIQRGEMNEAYAKEKVGLEAAIDFIGQAKKALEKFYDDHMFLVQVKRQEPYKVGVVEAGKDAPPPPPIVTKPYKGHGNNKGVQGMLEDIKTDVKDDLKKLESNEKKSVKAFEDTKKDLEDSIENKMDYKKETEEQIANKLEDISNEKASQLGEQDTLDAVVDTLKAAEPSCNYVFTTYDTRIDNRKIEAEGVDDAISALGGDPDAVKFKDSAK